MIVEGKSMRFAFERQSIDYQWKQKQKNKKNFIKFIY